MPLFKRKPVSQEVYAEVFKDDAGDEGKLPLGVQKAVFNLDGRPQLKFFIEGPDGPQFLSPDDYVVSDLSGDRPAYVVDKARFEAEYEAADEPEVVVESPYVSDVEES
jgi:hypothetical protein